MNDLRGSLWRRWDLHVHTPESALNNQFGGDWDLYVHTLITTAITKKIAVIGVTDYFSIQGYRRLREDYLSEPKTLRRLFAAEIAADSDYFQKIRDITVLPNIEFRLDVVIEKGGSKKLNIHVLFADDLTPQQIEDNFLSQLHFTFEGVRQERDDKRPLTRTNIEELGRRRKEQFPQLAENDFFEGCNAAAVDDEEISVVLSSNSLLRRSTAKRQFTSLVLSLRSASSRSALVLSAETCSDGMPASLKRRAM